MRHLFFLLLAIGVAACVAGEEPPPAAEEVEASVAIIDFAYRPATMEIGVEQFVRWTNEGDVAHTVTFEDGPDSGTLEPGQTFDQAFGSPGRYDYACTIHPQMRGLLAVVP